MDPDRFLQLDEADFDICNEYDLDFVCLDGAANIKTRNISEIDGHFLSLGESFRCMAFLPALMVELSKFRINLLVLDAIKGYTAPQRTKPPL